MKMDKIIWEWKVGVSVKGDSGLSFAEFDWPDREILKSESVSSIMNIA